MRKARLNSRLALSHGEGLTWNIEPSVQEPYIITSLTTTQSACLLAARRMPRHETKCHMDLAERFFEPETGATIHTAAPKGCYQCTLGVPVPHGSPRRLPATPNFANEYFLWV
jgi:hypothetical protein